MQFNDVAKTWNDSLKLLAWKELRLIILASANNFRRTFTLMVKYFWWLCALWITFLILPTIFHVVLAPHQIFDALVLEKIPTVLSPYRLYDVPWTFWVFTAMTLAFSAIDAVIYFLCFLSARASIEAKNFSYYILYLPKVFLFWVTQLLIGSCLAPIALIPSLFVSNSNASSIATTIIAMLFSSLPVLVGYTFFDHEKNTITHALKKGLTLFIHFFPLLATFSIMHIIILLSLYGLTMAILAITTMPFLIMSIVFAVFFIQTFIISMLFLSCYATLYLKIKHAHPNLFFA